MFDKYYNLVVCSINGSKKLYPALGPWNILEPTYITIPKQEVLFWSYANTDNVMGWHRGYASPLSLM